MKTLACIVLALLPAWIASGATRDNDDSCDISVLPAATLLLPYFEVDLEDPNGETTLLTFTNVSNYDVIARTTLWTDRGYPVLTFNVYLTGYDVHTLNLYDVFEHGTIASEKGTGTEVTKRGWYSDASPRIDLKDCGRLAGALTAEQSLRVRSAFTRGSIPGECAEVGGVHEHAIGYATVDVVGRCSSTMPNDPAYWTTDIRYDNVLIGEYQQVNRTRDLAQGGPMVHIRAIPEGGRPGDRDKSAYDAGFPRTFYSRFTKLDGRQPLPAQFAARWIQGGPAQFETTLKIWREGRTGIGARCSDFAAEDDMAVREIVAFDEQGNASSSGHHIELPVTSSTSVDDASIYPRSTNGATSGWMYLNLDRSSRDGVASQAWVISSMRAASQYSTDMDAVALGNGCSAPAEARQEIAPAPNASPAPAKIASTNNDDSCDIALLPAATLLLPYFEVDVEGEETTLFTVTNVSPQDRIARVTLWTDHGFPVLTFNVSLAPYDVQSINLGDVIRNGVLALDTPGCARPGHLAQAEVERMQSAFTRGDVSDVGDLQGCRRLSEEHANAIGYATVDVVSNCAANTPFTDAYWLEDIAWDNVLIGDYQQVDPEDHAAGGAPLVHIRAIPEGGTNAERLALPRKFDAGFQRTFYGRYAPARAPRVDGRQPLPSVFSARWEEDGSQTTSLKIWKEGSFGRALTCPTGQGDCTWNYADIVTFDDHENAAAYLPLSRIGFCPVGEPEDLPLTSRSPVQGGLYYTPLSNGALQGWIYLNLDDRRGRWFDEFAATGSWVISSIATAGRSAVDIEASALGNGCSWPTPVSEISIGGHVIRPAGNVNP